MSDLIERCGKAICKNAPNCLCKLYEDDNHRHCISDTREGAVRAVLKELRENRDNERICDAVFNEPDLILERATGGHFIRWEDFPTAFRAAIDAALESET